jgi:hypothetical protein
MSVVQKFSVSDVMATDEKLIFMHVNIGKEIRNLPINLELNIDCNSALANMATTRKIHVIWN